MTPQLQEKDASLLAARVAPEDLCRGDFVAVLSEIIELPSFLWSETLPRGQDELARISHHATVEKGV